MKKMALAAFVSLLLSTGPVSAADIEDMIALQGVDEGVDGVDDGLAWSLAISRKSGKSVLSASGAGVAYVVFGVCTPMSSAP